MKNQFLLFFVALTLSNCRKNEVLTPSDLNSDIAYIQVEGQRLSLANIDYVNQSIDLH